MKQVFLIVIILSLYSCSLDESGIYSESFGLVKNSVSLSAGNTLYIESDEGEILIPTQSISSFVQEGDRVWTSYLIIEENPRKDTLMIEPYRVSHILPVQLTRNSGQTDVNFQTDNIDLWQVWESQGFLTVDFRIRAQNQEKIKDHEYTLAVQKENADTLVINFIHDAKGDNSGVLCRTAIALKLSDIPIINNSLIIALNFKTLDGIKQTEYLTVKKEELLIELNFYK
jgi:hypothetical protein